MCVCARLQKTLNTEKMFTGGREKKKNSIFSPVPGLDEVPNCNFRALSYPGAEEKSVLKGQSPAGVWGKHQRYLGAVGCRIRLPEVSEI